jgi:hypothetical protein
LLSNLLWLYHGGCRSELAIWVTLEKAVRMRTLFIAVAVTVTAIGAAQTATASPNSGPSTQSSSSDAYYPNCAAARKAGVAPIRQGQPGYRSGLDRDGDGIACE